MAEFEIHDEPGSNRNPFVAAYGDGDGFLVAWDTNKSDTEEYDIRCKIYDNDLNTTHSFIANTNTVAHQVSPLIQILNEGFVIAWTNSSLNGILGQRFNIDGTARGEEFIMSDRTDLSQSLISIQK